MPSLNCSWISDSESVYCSLKLWYSDLHARFDVGADIIVVHYVLGADSREFLRYGVEGFTFLHHIYDVFSGGL